jgi:flagellar biogenesis protein FliO
LPDARTPPRAKRAVPTARAVAAEAPPLAAVRAPKPAPVAKRHVAPAAVVLQDPPLSGRPGFRARVPAPIVDDDIEDSGTNYALRLTEALEAISSAQSSAPLPRETRTAPPAPRPPKEKGRSGLARLGDSFANLPPIRLPIGPAIPWRLGLPALLVLLVVTIVVARPLAQADSQVSRLPTMPTPETYPVQQEAPLFTDAQPTPAPTPAGPLGVADSGGVGFDVLDVGLKLIAVLALAYGSLLLLKRAGMGGAAAIKTGGKSSGMQVVSSLTLAPNRTVHLLKVPGGKSLLVGATPNQVNLIADLGDISEELEPDGGPGSFFDILKGKISQ